MKKLIAVLFAVALVPAFAADKSKKDEKKAEPYTLTTCAVSDEKLGDMGDPYVFTHEGKELKLCCKSCKKDFDKNPKKVLTKVAKAEKAQKAEKKK